ncbi:MAG: hypothetical protein LKE52_03890 [Bacilli bacterium]|jgi:cbb3-type cytochrome oxidase subunit 3|nr:hypothetical protein [Bacilli bacterium]
MADKKKSRTKLYKSEIVWYSVFGVIFVFGFVVAILGVCAYNVGRLSDNALYQFEKSVATFFKQTGVCDFRLWGTLFMIVALIGFLISIYHYSNKASDEEAAKRRHAERLRILMDEETIDVSKKEEPAKEKNGEVPPDRTKAKAR